MTKEKIAELQLCHQKGGKTLKEYLRETGIGYSTYNYCRKKYLVVKGSHFVNFELKTFILIFAQQTFKME